MANKKLVIYLPIQENKQIQGRIQQLKRTIANPLPYLELPKVQDVKK
jgi:hypothetical protein